MLSFCAYFPTFYDSNSLCMSDVEIPGLGTIPVRSIPKALHDSKHLFTSSFVKNGRDLIKADGLLVNTFESFENETLTALRCGRVQPDFPSVISIGPLVPIKSSVLRVTPLFSWLDNQPDKSVVYVSFGSRTTMSKEQIQELALGLEASKCRFLWIVKTTVVDKEEEIELEDLLGEGFLKRVKDRGLAIKGWVEQEEILEHKAVGGFISHCGWNSVIEAAMNGVRVLAWPRSGDQRINAGVVASSGLGIWAEDWSWEGDKELITATNIAQSVKQLMTNEGLMEAAQRIGKEARKAAEPGGGSAEGFPEIVRKLV
ncbi:hypothetical protein LUZ60_000111 [Juncus effusus]|nr:hypothetical protein LUZ60_000111 [Juncus effusus]